MTLKGGDDGSVEMLEELRDHVAAKIGAIAKPANIVFTPELPKTRSGKIMRRLLRDVAEHRPLGDTTTLADPTVVDEIAGARGRDAGRRGLISPLRPTLRSRSRRLSRRSSNATTQRGERDEPDRLERRAQRRRDLPSTTPRFHSCSFQASCVMFTAP